MDDFVSAYYASLIHESSEWNTIISEALITFGGKAYPKYGQVIIVSGGSGSGKGFVIDNLFGIEGKRYDVDYLKEVVAKDKLLRKQFSKQFNVDESVFDMKTSEDVSTVHEIVKKSGLKQKYENQIFMMAKNAPENEKPNLIFDKTCKTFDDFYYVVETVKKHGYKPENIHFVWVLNDFETAMKQNSERSRHVHPDLMESIHTEVAHTMKKLFNNIENHIDGDVWIAFNKRDTDVSAKKLNKGQYSKNDTYYIDHANTVKIKDAGKKNLKLDYETLRKIKEYVPKDTWN